jgi:hypothetical protein
MLYHKITRLKTNPGECIRNRPHPGLSVRTFRILQSGQLNRESVGEQSDVRGHDGRTDRHFQLVGIKAARTALDVFNGARQALLKMGISRRVPASVAPRPAAPVFATGQFWHQWRDECPFIS